MSVCGSACFKWARSRETKQQDKEFADTTKNIIAKPELTK